MSKKIIIMRGPSGSGKSTYIKKHFPDAFSCSADGFFVKNGVYAFDPTKIGEAHARCMTSFISATMGASPKSLIVVDNTNITIWEFFNYCHIGSIMGYEFEVHSLFYSADREVCKARNQHSVPPETIDWQFDNYEPADSEINLNLIGY
jgi:predicted kinase